MILKLKDIHKFYQIGKNKTLVLKGINLSIKMGDMTAIMGASGCGKSTLMNIIGLLDTDYIGQYFIKGRNVSRLSDKELSFVRNKEIGFVFQQFNLLQRLTVIENIALPLVYRGIEEKKREYLSLQILKRLGLYELYSRKPAELSGGQQQRVAIARAIVGSPSIILADEPTGSLDSATSSEIVRLFKRLNIEDKITIIIVTHNPEVAANCKKKFNMTDGIIERN